MLATVHISPTRLSMAIGDIGDTVLSRMGARQKLKKKHQNRRALFGVQAVVTCVFVAYSLVCFTPPTSFLTRLPVATGGSRATSPCRQETDGGRFLVLAPEGVMSFCSCWATTFHLFVGHPSVRPL